MIQYLSIIAGLLTILTILLVWVSTIPRHDGDERVACAYMACVLIAFLSWTVYMGTTKL